MSDEKAETDLTRPRDLVGYGRHIPRVTWPDQAKVAVNFVVNYEEGSEHYERLGDRSTDGMAELNWYLPAPHRDFAMEAVYEYGSRAGIWRLLNIFGDYSVPVTFFATGKALELNREVAAAIGELGHEPCSHGYRWSEPWHMTREEEAEQIRRAIESIRETTGTRPVGWYWRYSSTPWTRELLADEGGFLYDSETYNDDLPYFTEVSGRRHLVIPYTQTYNDTRFTVAEGGFGSPTDFFDYMRRGLDELHLEGQRGFPKMMTIGLHARLAGQAGRANAVREFIEYALDKGDVWFARRDAIATWWIEHSAEWL
ncbi:polysaccharide deacetylase family protein [Streptomyces naphthomycinicus]|uniref:polysaccharide deacetylase family protein n=1 Tax=Streptomyces naphthomycinicus TaxID=2872625 RepID=UPI001CECDF95|nr:polysaccharide deacetylase family protein [Streptomyces sp. TML10]